MLRGTDFEFRYRMFLMFLVFGAGFGLYHVDPVNSAYATVRDVVGPHGAIVPGLHLVFGLGALLLVLSAALRTWASAYMRTEVVHDMKVHTETLVADGPYRHLRNPLYLGTLLMALGLLPMASRLGAAFIGVFALLWVLRLIGHEEARLDAEQGEDYRRYRDAVPSLFPALRPRLAAGGTAPRYGQAFIGELGMWAFAFAGVAYAITLDLPTFWVTAGVGLLILMGITAATRFRRRVRTRIPGAK